MQLSAQQRDVLERFAAAVASSPHNLVSRRDRTELLTRHVPESEAIGRLLPPGPARLLDIGTGGGFPGFVIAVTRPDLEVHLLDSTSKKTRFLAEIARELAVEVTVHTGRAEDLGRGDLAGGFDAVTARAVAPLDRLVGLAAPFLRAGGTLFAIKGERWRDELDTARPVIARAGLVVAATPEDAPVVPLGDPQRGGEPGSVSIPRVVMLRRNAAAREHRGVSESTDAN
ncbi:MAG: 16S rRNA (guanine(527)-N(7))-methyltransferase RsmG [Nitriliruptoraceae bacterium]